MIEATNFQKVPRFNMMRRDLSKYFWILLLVSVAHLPLGLVIYSAGSFALVHPIAVLCFGLYWALDREVPLERVAFVMAYLVGAEVLWRMAQVPVYWEFGKYGSALIAIVALIRRENYVIPKLPLIYFAVLIPGCAFAFYERSLSAAQEVVSTQISGPFFLAIACWFFSYCTFDQFKLRNLLFTIIVPLLSVAFATFFFTISNDEITFTGESNFATSGGFGPNQVSAMLGLGVFVSFASLLIFQNPLRVQVYLMIAAILFAAQSVMTFSRGGIYNAIGAIVVVILLEIQRPSMAAKRAIPLIASAFVFVALIFPILDNYTGGMLGDRFDDTNTTSRLEIAQSDIRLLLENPMYGVGVGNSADSRSRFLDRSAMSHTEFSRLLSEHGILGVLALLMLILMLVVNFRKQRTVMGRAFAAGCAVWCCLFMTNVAMRLAAPSFVWGLMYATIAVIGPVRRDSQQKDGLPA